MSMCNDEPRKRRIALAVLGCMVLIFAALSVLSFTGSREQALPHLSSTKSMTGHSLGATGAQEAIYCLLMLKHGFVAPSINIENLDPGAGGLPIAQQRIDGVAHDVVLSNSFGFGGTNCTLAFASGDD